jgi:DNA-binding CsgD family transcriptional regulator/tetratricopeptide (TPR) repeat protein
MMLAMAPRVMSPVFVGRHQELQVLEAALARASAGRASTVLIGGEAGIGKTRLVDEFVATARATGATVLHGTCVSLGDEGLPFAPVAEALRGLRRTLGPDALAELMDAGTSELASIAPELGSIADQAQPTARPDWAQTRVFEALLTLVARLGERAPVVFVIEDLHWADRTTRDVITFLTHNLAAERVMVVATYRSDELNRRHPLRPWLAEMDRDPHVARIELERLDTEELAAQLEAILEHPPGGDLLETIVRRSGGNPFFAEELLAAGATGDQDQLPDNLRDLLLVRVHALGDPVQEVLGCAAVAGPTFDHDILIAPCQADERAVSAALREAIAAQLVVADPATGAYAFRHALLQEAVYEELLPRDRREYHARYAEALSERPVPDGALGASQLAALAHHATQAHDLPLALRGWVDAARASARVYGLAEAAHAYDRAIELWDAVAPEARPAGVDMLDILYEAALVLMGTGQLRRAREVAALGVERSSADRDPIRAALMRERYARSLWIDGDLNRAIGVLDEAVELVRGRPTTAESARVVASFAGLLMLRDHNARSIEVGNEALAMARSIGAREVEASALAGLGVAMVNQGDCVGGLAMLRQALAMAHELQMSVIDFHRVYANLSSCLESCGELEEAVDVALEGVAWARTRGVWRLQGTFLESNAASTLLELGRWSEALQLVERRDLRVTEGVARLNSALVAGPLNVRLGRLETARATLNLAIDRVRTIGDAQFAGPIYNGVVELAIAEGRFDDACRLANEGIGRLDGSEEVGNRYRMELLSQLLTAQARGIADARGRRDADAVASVKAGADRAIAESRHWATMPAGPPRGFGGEALGFAAMAEAEYAGIADRPDPDAWAHAAARWSDLGRPWPVAQCRARQAEAVLATRRSRAEAIEPLTEARAIARGLGAEPLASWCDSLARMARLELPGAAEPAADGVGGDGAHAPGADAAAADGAVPNTFGLTSRELDVLGLLVAGYSNRQIGETLFISESTAGVHVSNILGKLGVSGRVEAAAVAVRAGLID